MTWNELFAASSIQRDCVVTADATPAKSLVDRAFAPAPGSAGAVLTSTLMCGHAHVHMSSHWAGTPVRVPGCTPSVGEPECAPMFASITPDGRWLYVTNQDSGDLSTFAIGAAGMLTPVGDRVPAGGRPEGMAISPDGRFLYASSIDANAVSAFTIGPDGQLGPLGVFPTCENFQDPAACGAVATAVTPDGGAVYALDVFSNQLAAFTVA
jgi:hypothetical protein